MDSVKGKLQGVDCEFRYDRQDEVLYFQCEGLTRSIDDRNVVAVIEDKTSNDSNDGKDRVQRILVSQSPKEPFSTDSKLGFNFQSLEAVNLPEFFTRLHLISRNPEHLFVPPYHDGTSNLHIIISIRSGTGEAQQLFDTLLKGLLDSIELNEKHYSLHVTESEVSVSDLVRTCILPRANEGFAQTILILAGDGGVFDTINALRSSPQTDSYVKPVLGLLALGTGNALAHSTGLIRGSDRGLRSLLIGTPHVLPTFAATFSPGAKFVIDEGHGTEPLPTLDNGYGIVYGAVVCSWALHASLVAESDTSEYRKFGKDRFQMAAKELLFPSNGLNTHIYKGKITLFRKDSHGHQYDVILERHEHLYILASLVSNLEEKLKISPRSKPLDSQLRLLHIGPIPGADVMKIMGLAYQDGRHVSAEAVGYDDIIGFRIDFEEDDDRWRRICIDGKIIVVKKGGWISVRTETRDFVDIIADL